MSSSPAGLLDLAALAGYLDACSLGSGSVRATRIGEGSSNLTFLVERDGLRAVLRRPPPPPLPPSAHDVVREARIQIGVGRAGGRVPTVMAVCEDDSVLGAPFYVMELLSGVVPTNTLPARLDALHARQALGYEVVDTLAELHGLDWQADDLAWIGRPQGYLERQLRRWRGLWEINATRPLPLVQRVGDLLEASRPREASYGLVHGDYRLGNLMVASEPPARVVAVLDWEMATLGDPLADVGYLVAGWSEPGAEDHPLLLSPVTSRDGFPRRRNLVRRYVEQTGRDVMSLAWYEALALWKAAVFCEAIYRRYLAGERSDVWAASLENGVPRLVELAYRRLEG